MIEKRIPVLFRKGTVLSQVPIISDVAVSLIGDTGFTVTAIVDPKGTLTPVLHYGLTSAYGSTVNATEGEISAEGTVTFTLTGLSQNTLYHYKIVAGETETADATQTTTDIRLLATLAATGNGTGVTTISIEVSETQTFEILSGNAKFYTDAAGTTGESTTREVTTGAIRTLYLKSVSGESILKIPKRANVINWGNSVVDGLASATNAPSITIAVGRLNLSYFRITGLSTILGALPAGLSAVRLSGASVNWTSSDPLPDGLTYILLGGTYIDWTGLDIGDTGNIGTFQMSNMRLAKMSSADMVTLLTQLTNRTGTLPATITINDYADYASPPSTVTDAVAALKVAKPSVTTVNLGA